PALRERKDDIVMLFKKFSSDFAEKYRIPPLQLSEDAERQLVNHRWSGNVRQLKNLAEQISVIEKDRYLTSDTINHYLADKQENMLPVLFSEVNSKVESLSEREILYKLLFEMKRDITDMKKIIMQMLRNGQLSGDFREENAHLIKKLYHDRDLPQVYNENPENIRSNDNNHDVIESYEEAQHEYIEESLSIQKKEKDLIEKALQKHSGRRKKAARELGISERTLYRKIKEYDIE
uniref:helix-turn-helix domain-containing protein n=1 Tax=Natronospira sp. TaxID=2024970 RepID=UPI0038736448